MHEHLALAGFLSKESNEAARVKRKTPVTVVIGNPPYAGHSANESAWIAGLLRGVDGQGRLTESYFEVDGHDLGERQPKWLNDDYVKFIRFGQWRINQTGAGIMAFITNHGYLDNPTFRGMRQSLMADFDAIYVLDLHGSTKKRETTPNGHPDENVFDILPGVAILLAVKRPAKVSGPPVASEVWHADMWGVRGQKYTLLLRSNAQRTEWQHLEPSQPFYLFVPQDVALRGEYQQGRKVTEIFPANSVGIVTARDSMTVHLTQADIWDTVRGFVKLPVEKARREYGLGRDSQSWQVYRAQQDIRASGVNQERITPLLYRPFDTRFTYYTGKTVGFMARPMREVMCHLLTGTNLGLVVARNLEVERPYDQFLCTRTIIQHHTLSIKEVNYLLPLYLDADHATLFSYHQARDAPSERRPNLASEFVSAFQESVGLVFVPQGQGNLRETFGPEDVFFYAYSVFHSPTYRTRYYEFLKRDFPCLPLTSDRALFAQLVGLGADLVALHLLEDDYPFASWNQQRKDSVLQHPITTFVERTTGTAMGAFSKSTCYQEGGAPGLGRVYLDTSQRSRSSYFDGVPEDVWDFHIGGYQVLHKWLYDRRGTGGQPGRTLTPDDIDHYQRIVVALKETMRLMEEIDEVIDAHGGWPIE
jgi:predicted helicase